MRKLVQKPPVQKCCICDNQFTGWGNNPEPVDQEGRSCDDCNNVVMEARHQIYQRLGIVPPTATKIMTTIQINNKFNLGDRVQLKYHNKFVTGKIDLIETGVFWGTERDEPFHLTQYRIKFDETTYGHNFTRAAEKWVYPVKEKKVQPGVTIEDFIVEE